MKSNISVLASSIFSKQPPCKSSALKRLKKDSAKAHPLSYGLSDMLWQYFPAMLLKAFPSHIDSPCPRGKSMVCRSHFYSRRYTANQRLNFLPPFHQFSARESPA